MAKAAGTPSSTETGSTLSDARILEIYRSMLLARAVDDRCLMLQRQGRIGFYVPLSGQEAAQVGCAAALEFDDWIFPAYRELGLVLW
ncbi:MAG: thiamine pyrophosphate-dependent enzyme, partial [Thermoplasmata archaeon]